MARKVMWTETAWGDLEEVADYIAKDSSHYAAALVREARDPARTLAHLVESHRSGVWLAISQFRKMFLIISSAPLAQHMEKGSPLTWDKLNTRLERIFCPHRQITRSSFVIISFKSVIIYQDLMSKEVYYACSTIYLE